MPGDGSTNPALDTQRPFSLNLCPYSFPPNVIPELAPSQCSAPDPNPIRRSRNYHDPSAISHKAIRAGFEERRAKIVIKRRRGLGSDSELISKEDILQAAVKGKRRANAVMVRSNASWGMSTDWKRVTAGCMVGVVEGEGDRGRGDGSATRG